MFANLLHNRSTTTATTTNTHYNNVICDDDNDSDDNAGNAAIVVAVDDSEHDFMMMNEQRRSPISFYYHSPSRPSPSSKSFLNNSSPSKEEKAQHLTTISSRNNSQSNENQKATFNRTIPPQQKRHKAATTSPLSTTFWDDCESGISMNCRCRKASVMIAFMIAIIVTFYSNISLVIKLGSAKYMKNHPYFLASTDETFHHLQQMLMMNGDESDTSSNNLKKNTGNIHVNIGDDDDPLESLNDDATDDDNTTGSTDDGSTTTDTLHSPSVQAPSSPQKQRMKNMNNPKNNKNMGRLNRSDSNQQKRQRGRTSGAQQKKLNARATIQDIVPTEQSLSSNATLSACLLIKDDNEILSEWIAYHYHTITLRHLIVAVDPLSSESPTAILAKWKLLTDLNIRLWHDEHYMPDEFIETGQAPSNFIARETDLKNSKMRQESIIEISNHRYRQRVFLASCLREMRAEGNSWVIHIDTDEYVVPSKLLRQMKPKYIEIPPIEQPGSVLSLLQQVAEKTTRNVNYPCISMLRVLYGSVESSFEEQSAGVPVEYNATKFESLRWRYHALPHHAELHGNPKVVIDVQAIPARYFEDTIVFSIHRPVRQYCPTKSDLAFSNFRKQPIGVNHYLGSWERYSGRNDKRRSRDKYDLKASVNRGHDDGLRMWLHGFVNTMGRETAMKLLGEQYLSDQYNGHGGSSSNNYTISLPRTTEGIEVSTQQQQQLDVEQN